MISMTKSSTNRNYEYKVRDHLLDNGFSMLIRAASSGQFSPDMVAVGKKIILVEVKSIRNYTYRPTNSPADRDQYDRYRQTYKDTGHPVYYAVCFKGVGKIPATMLFFKPDYNYEKYPAFSVYPEKTKHADTYEIQDGELVMKRTWEWMV